MTNDTETVLRDRERERTETARRAVQDLARAYITRHGPEAGWPEGDLEEVLAALGLDGAEPAPEGACRICGAPRRIDRKICQRLACVQERARQARALEGGDGD